MITDTDESTLEHLGETLQALFANSHLGAIHPEITLSIGMSDDDGENWQIDLNGPKCTILRNGLTVGQGASLPWMTAGAKRSQNVLYRAYQSRDKIGIRPIEHHRIKDITTNMLQERCVTSCQRVATLMDEPSLLDPQRILALAERLGLVFVQIGEVDTLIKKVRDGSLPTPEESSVRKLGDELLLIEKMRGLVSAIAKGTENGKSIKGELEACELEISELTKGSGILEDQVNSLSVAYWTELIAAAAKVESVSQLMKTGDETHKTLTGQLAPFCHQQMDALRKILDPDEQLSQDLTKHIQLAVQEAARPRRYAEKMKARLRDLVRRLMTERIQGAFPSLAHRMGQGQVLDGTATHALANVQLHAQQAVYCINEMARHIDRTKESVDQVVDLSQSKQEKLTREVARARSDLRMLAERSRIPHGLNLEQLIELASAQMVLKGLFAQRDLLMGRQHRRREQLIELQKQVLEWRRCTASQKQGDLKSASILLNEARSICQYLEEKEASFRRQVEAREHGLAREATVGQVKMRHQELLGNWHRACVEVGIGEKPHQDPRWPQFLRAAQEIKALIAIQGDAKETPIEDFLDQSQETNSIAIYLVMQPLLSASHTTWLLETLVRKGRNCGFHLLFSTDRDLLQRATAFGIATAAPTVEKAGASLDAKTRSDIPSPQIFSTSTASTPTRNEKSNAAPSVISPRARAVLDLLNTTRALPPKGHKLNSNS